MGHQLQAFRIKKSIDIPSDSDPLEKEENVIGKVFAKSSITRFVINTAKPLPIVSVDSIKHETLTKVKIVTEYGYQSKRSNITTIETVTYFPRQTSLTIIKGFIYFRDRIVFPKRYHSQVSKELYLYLDERQKISSPSLDGNIKMSFRCCGVCDINSLSPNKANLEPWPPELLSKLHIIYSGQIKNFCCVSVTALTKWAEVSKKQTTTSQQTTYRLEEAFSHNGLSDRIISYNDPRFTSAQFKKSCTDRENKHTTTAPYTLQSTDQSKRFVQSLKVLKKLEIEGNMNEVLLTHRITPFYNRSMTLPYDLLTRRQAKSKLDLLMTVMKSSIKRYTIMEHQFESKPKNFVISEPVFVITHLTEILQQCGVPVFVISAHMKFKSTECFNESYNILLDSFDIQNQTHKVVEPVIVPEAEENTDDVPFHIHDAINYDHFHIYSSEPSRLRLTHQINYIIENFHFVIIITNIKCSS